MLLTPIDVDDLTRKYILPITRQEIEVIVDEMLDKQARLGNTAPHYLSISVIEDEVQIKRGRSSMSRNFKDSDGDILRLVSGVYSKFWEVDYVDHYKDDGPFIALRIPKKPEEGAN
jgi:hypothetical protein